MNPEKPENLYPTPNSSVMAAVRLKRSEGVGADVGRQRGEAKEEGS
jgi:hypothetical protein